MIIAKYIYHTGSLFRWTLFTVVCAGIFWIDWEFFSVCVLGSLCTCVVFSQLLCIIPYANTPFDWKKEWRNVINRAFILKEHGTLSQIHSQLEIREGLCFFFHSLGILCLVLNPHMEHIQKLSVVLWGPRPVALVLVSISHVNISAAYPTFDKPVQILFFFFLFLSCFYTSNCRRIQVHFFFPPPIQGCILVKPWFCYFDTVLPPRDVILYYKRVLKKARNVTK